MDIVYIDNDNIVEITALTNELTDARIGSAAVAVTLQTASGTAITGLATGVSWPLTMNAASGATGTYRTTLPYTLSLTAGTTYYAAITASGGAGLYGEWLVPVRAVTRT